jgi:hypothetical protein
MSYGTAEETIKNVALLNAALGVIEQHAEAETPEQIAEFIRIPLIARNIAVSLDDDDSLTDVLKALEMPVPILKDLKTLKNIGDGFTLYQYVDAVLDNLKDDSRPCDLESDAPIPRDLFLNVLSGFRVAMDRINAWVAAGRYKFGFPSRKSFFTAVTPSDPAGMHSRMAWMDTTDILRRVAALIKDKHIQEE